MGSACPDPSELDALVAGQLAAAARPGIESHLDACPACAAVVAAMLRMFPPPEPPLPYAATAVGSNPPPIADEAPAPAATLGRYRLGARLGAGAMGVVFAAHDPELDRPVAVKLLHPGASGDLEVQRARLLREAQAMAKLSHPNVVAVFDVGRVADQLFLAMELIDGVTLTRWIAGAPRSRAELLAMFVQVGRGIAAAHAVGLVHRDFKPDNVLVAADGRPRVTDFGLARPLAAQDRSDLAQAMHHAVAATATGALVGTPAYMAPEQLCSEPATSRSDQFAFCIALWEALFGARPFEGNSLAAIADNVLAGRMRAIPARTPRWLRALLIRGLSTDPAARFPSMTALLDELGRDHGRIRRYALSAGAMAAGVAVIVAALQFTMKAASPPPPIERAPVVAAASPAAPGAMAAAAPATSPAPAPIAAQDRGAAAGSADAVAARSASPAPITAHNCAPSAADSPLAVPPHPATPAPDGSPPSTTAQDGRNPAVGSATARGIAAGLAPPAPAAAPGPRRASAAVSRTPHGIAETAPAARRFPRAAAIASIDTSCRIPYDAAHPDPALGKPVLDWGKVTRIDRVAAQLGGEDVELEVLEIAGQRATYRTENDFGPLGSLAAKPGDLIALCGQGTDTRFQLASGPLTVTHLILPLSAPPRLGEIAPFAPLHTRSARIREAAERGKLGAGRYLVYSEVARADGDQLVVERDGWRFTVASGAPGADRIAPGKRLWLVVGEPTLGSTADGVPVPVLKAFAAIDDLFP